jgi:fused signal recognition particle receptor
MSEGGEKRGFFGWGKKKSLSEPDSEVIAEPQADEAASATAPEQEQENQDGFFSRLRKGLSRSSSHVSDGITGIFTKAKLDADTLQDLEDLLITSDLGVETAAEVAAKFGEGRFDKEISPDEVKTALAEIIAAQLTPVARPLEIDAAAKPHVILMVGVNGAGKTTTIGKMAQRFKDEGKRVVLAAGDTFRAAAVEQLKVWGTRTGAEVIARDIGADAAGLAFDALTRAKDEGADVLMIDTAGRLQNRKELMDELAKIVRVLKKQDETAPHSVILVLDASTGQNALSQAKVFTEIAGVTGLVMTKLDGTARGGILVALAAKFDLPIHAIGVGEGIEDLQAFEPIEFAEALVGVERK